MHSLEQFKEMVDDQLDHLLPKISALYPSLSEGARYTLLAPSKRIRPILTLASAEMLQTGAYKEALLPACAIEIVHTYSLIHDDLPCMDDAVCRRGQPALHTICSEGHAVLVGDYLLTYAFEVLASASRLSSVQKIALVGALAKSAGGEGMIGGQIMDIEKSSSIEEMHQRKTAALFQSSLEFGGIVADAPPPVLRTLKTYGMQLGLLFQLVDDILDKDHSLGEEKAIESMHALYQQTLKTLNDLPGDSTLLHQITSLVMEQTTAVG